MGDDGSVVIAAELARRENHRLVVDLPDGSHAEILNRARDEGEMRGFRSLPA